MLNKKRFFAMMGEVKSKHASSLTAACVTGELRGGMFPSSVEQSRLNVLRPLQSDAFAVLSQSWSKHGTRVYYGALPDSVTSMDVARFLDAWQPLGSVLTRDDVELLSWIESKSSSSHHEHAQFIMACLIKVEHPHHEHARLIIRCHFASQAWGSEARK